MKTSLSSLVARKMRNVLVLSLALSTCPLLARAANTPAEVLDHYPLCMVNGGVTDNLVALIGPWVGERVGTYVPPTAATMNPTVETVRSEL